MSQAQQGQGQGPAIANMSNVRTDPSTQGTQIVHVREGSQNDFDALFDVLKQAPPMKQVPMKQRNLPASFFSPRPRQGNHSRESSADSTGYNIVGLQGINHGGTLPRPGPPSLPVSHGRSHSSPAGLHQTLSAAPQQTHSHMKTASFDIAEDQRPLPPGWEIATTPRGERYFLNHNDQSTSWEDPRKLSLSNNALNQPQTSPPLAPLSQTSPPLATGQNLGLPSGWEQATTPEGEIYFINHTDKSTSWYDPRLPKHLQKLGVRSLPAAHLSTPTSLPAVPPQTSPQAAATALPTLQRAPGQTETQFQTQLQRLQREKQLLLKRQQEISRQEHELQHLLTTRVSSPPTSGAPSSSEMQAVSTSGVDPFLGQGNPSEFHARQNSADSGLGGMGTSYSLPRTPEDFLGNVDEMETQETGPKCPNLPTDFPLDTMQGTSMDVSNLGDTSGENSQGPTGMDSDDLVPSLQEDISNELLNDIDGQKMENLLTWL